MNRFYFTGFLGSSTHQLLNDVKSVNNVSVIDDIIAGFSNKTIQSIHQWWFTRMIPRVELPSFNFWNKYYPIYNIDYSQDDNHYIVFCNSGLVKAYDRAFFESLKRKNPNIKLILYIVDPMNGYGCKRIKYIESVFDLVTSHVKEDCEAYHYKYFPLFYSKEQLKNYKQQDEDRSDIYFCGNNGAGDIVKNGKKEYQRGGRVGYLQKIYDSCILNNVKTNFYMNGVNELDKRDGDIRYNIPISNYDNIQNVYNTNCILEIMHDGFNAITTRYL